MWLREFFFGGGDYLLLGDPNSSKNASFSKIFILPDYGVTPMTVVILKKIMNECVPPLGLFSKMVDNIYGFGTGWLLVCGLPNFTLFQV